MQKKAARRGQRALAFLLCLLMAATLLPVMGASAAEGVDVQPADTVTATEGLNMSKQLQLTSDGTYTITLEAYATGTVSSVKVDKPMDIVLVLDQSGSMKNTFSGYTSRLNALKAAVNQFLNSISKKAKGSDGISGTPDDIAHRVAIVGFASDKNYYNVYKNTELLSTSSVINYGSATNENYRDALVSINGKNGNTNSQLISAVNRLDADGDTYSEYGLDMANKIFANATDDGQTRGRVVVVFTDGYTAPSGSNDLKYSMSDNAIAQAKIAKQTYQAKVFTVGIFANANPEKSITTNFKSSDGWNNNKNNLSSAEELVAANRYMHYMSSNHPTADNLNSDVSRWSNSGYYMAASDTKGLNGVFSKIDSEISNPSTTLTTAAVLKDIISDNFDVPSGSNATAASYQVTTEDGETYTVGNKVQDYTATFDKATKTVSVTGFDYKEKYVAAGHAGEKLVVTITGLLPNQSGTKLYSNNNEKSGIYTNSDDEVPFAPFDKPYTNVDTETRVVDFGMTVKIGDNVLKTNKATHEYGTFSQNSNKYTYNLNSVKDGNGNYTFGFTGVDSSLYFADGAWTKVNVIPANNVYYDDAYLNGDDTGSSTFKDGQYGYEAAVETATNAADFKPEGSTTSYTAKQTFSFTGSRIDLYCTTTNNSNAVVAALWKAEDFGKDDTQPVASKYMINTYESGTLYNVPTLSFDTGVRGNYVLVLYTNGTSNYQFDGVRVYNPADETNDTVKGAYTAENEANAQFLKVRDLLVQAGNLGNPGVVYTDEQDDVNAPSTYYDIGPKNEVYLAAKNGVSFRLDGYNAAAYKVMVGLSAPEGMGNGQVTVTYGDQVTKVDVNSVNDMYYEVKPDANGNVSIVNSGNVLVSVTNIKVTARNTASAASTASVVVDEDLLNYVSTFSTLSVVDTTTPDTPDPIPDTPVQNDSISAIIHAIWAQVKDSIDRLFGRL